jgi:transcriptional regulator with XRE-family HTH domain
MVSSNTPKHVRNLGRQLKEARESQGHNLAILARQCDLSVVQLTAIERGDTLAFARSQSNLLVAIQTYAKVLGVSFEDIEGLNNSPDDDIYIPEFLRKK